MEDDENRPLFALSVCSFFQIFPEGIGNGEVIFPTAKIDIGFIFSVKITAAGGEQTQSLGKCGDFLCLFGGIGGILALDAVQTIGNQLPAKNFQLRYIQLIKRRMRQNCRAACRLDGFDAKGRREKFPLHIARQTRGDITGKSVRLLFDIALFEQNIRKMRPCDDFTACVCRHLVQSQMQTDGGKPFAHPAVADIAAASDGFHAALENGMRRVKA